MKVSVTKHARKRLKERMGLPKSSIDRMANKVFESGTKHYETRGILHKWMSEIYLKHGSGNQMRIYGDYLYIFHQNTLITLFPVPSEIKTHLTDYIKKGERHIKKGGYITEERNLDNENQSQCWNS